MEEQALLQFHSLTATAGASDKLSSGEESTDEAEQLASRRSLSAGFVRRVHVYDVLAEGDAETEDDGEAGALVGVDVWKTVVGIVAFSLLVALPSILELGALAMISQTSTAAAADAPNTTAGGGGAGAGARGGSPNATAAGTNSAAVAGANISAAVRDRAPLFNGVCTFLALALFVVTPLWARCANFDRHRLYRWPPQWMWMTVVIGMPLPLFVMVLMVQMYRLRDCHWYYVDHELVLVILLAGVGVVSVLVFDYVQSVTIVKNNVCSMRELIASILVKPFRYWLLFVQSALLLLGASMLRYKLLHEYNSNALQRYLIILGGIVLQFSMNRILASVFSYVQNRGVDVLLEMLQRDKIPASVPGSIFLGSMRDWMGHIFAYNLAFMNKLLITGLQSWREALLFSMLMVVVEIAETSYIFHSASCTLAELQEVEADLLEIQKDMNGRPNLALHSVLSKNRQKVNDQRVEIVMLAIKHLTAQMLEYNVTLTAVVAAVIFDGNSIVTGFSNGFWSLQTGCIFLFTQFVPEVLADIIGLSILKRFGLKVHRLFSHIHSDPCVLALKSGIGCVILPLVALVAQERLWGI